MNPNLPASKVIPGNFTFSGDVRVLGSFNQGQAQKFINTATPSAILSAQRANVFTVDGGGPATPFDATVYDGGGPEDLPASSVGGMLAREPTYVFDGDVSAAGLLSSQSPPLKSDIPSFAMGRLYWIVPSTFAPAANVSDTGFINQWITTGAPFIPGLVAVRLRWTFAATWGAAANMFFYFSLRPTGITWAGYELKVDRIATISGTALERAGTIDILLSGGRFDWWINTQTVGLTGYSFRADYSGAWVVGP